MDCLEVKYSLGFLNIELLSLNLDALEVEGEPALISSILLRFSNWGLKSFSIIVFTFKTYGFLNTLIFFMKLS